MSFTSCDFTEGSCLFFYFSYIFSSPGLLRIMLHILFSLLGMPRRVKKVLAFFQIIRFEAGSSIKILSSKIDKNISTKYDAILSRQGMPSTVPN